MTLAPKSKGYLAFSITSGCPWPKATMKSPMGACNFRPLFFIFSYFLLFIFTALDALPCPAPPLPCPALSLPCPCPTLPLPLPCPALFRIFLLLPGTGGGSYTGNGQCFFFLLPPGTGGGSYTGNGQCFFFLLPPGIGGGSYTGNFFSFCCEGQEEEVTQGTGNVFFFPFAARDRRKKLHKERAMFFFPFADRDRRKKLHRERAWALFFFSFCS